MMRSTLTEAKFLFYIIGATLLLMLIHIYHPQLAMLYDRTNYVSFHTLLEFFSIVISMAIFLNGWKRLEKERTSRILFISLTFFIVGMVDLLHTLSFKGMPYFITPSSVGKATWAWVIARILESVFMLMVLLLPDKKLKKDYRTAALLLSAFFVGVVAFLIIFYEKRLPLLVVEGKGTTFIKNGIEYAVSFMQFLSIIISLYQYYLEKKLNQLYVALAFTFLFLSELNFTIYLSIFDIDNFSGHLFKMVGYYFILKGIYFSSSNDTEEIREEDSSTEIEAVMIEHPGILFKFKKIGDHFVYSYCDGDLLYQMGYSPSEMVGKDVSDFFSGKESNIFDFYQFAWETRERITFTARWRNKSIVISLKPLFEGRNKSEVMGVVTDISDIVQTGQEPKPYPPVIDILRFRQGQ